MKKRIAIFGSTGSIGTQALEVTDCIPDKFEITALSCGSNIELLNEQIEKYKPKYACVKNEADISRVKAHGAEILYGEKGLEAIAVSDCADIILAAASGLACLKPVTAGIKSGKDIALANKEILVSAGSIIMQLAAEYGVKILPVDSEHSAVFQCLNQNRKAADRLIITASGGPFLNASKEEMAEADLKEALNHPRWKMGKKITVDSAVLMNKGLEVIEAHHLFNFDYERIKVVIHPQSYIHSAVEFKDGSIIAQIGVPSMHIPIQYALTYPDRYEGIKTESFDFVKAGRFDFSEPDYEKFPSLELAVSAGKKSGSAPAVLNAANEAAVYAFLDNKIKLTDIYKITKKVLDNHACLQNPSIEEILDESAKAEAEALGLISSFSG